MNFSFPVIGPRLRIFRTSTNSVVVVWPISPPGFALEQSGDLRWSSWAPAPGAISQVGAENHFVVKPPAGKNFYRLKN